MDNVFSWSSLLIVPITGAISWIAARRIRQNDTIVKMQHTINEVLDKNGELITEITKLRDENADLKVNLKIAISENSNLRNDLKTAISENSNLRTDLKQAVLELKRFKK